MFPCRQYIASLVVKLSYEEVLSSAARVISSNGSILIEVLTAEKLLPILQIPTSSTGIC